MTVFIDVGIIVDASVIVKLRLWLRMSKTIVGNYYARIKEEALTGRICNSSLLIGRQHRGAKQLS